MIGQYQVIWCEVFHDATFLKDSNIINIPLEQIGNKAGSPIGVTAIRHSNLLVCLYDEKVFPCLAKFLEHSTLNSVQSTMHCIFLMVLNTLGRNLLSWALCGNMKFCMSRKVTYINWMKVVKIFRTCDGSIFLSGVLRRAERVLTVNPLFSLGRQINSFSLEGKSLLGPVLALSFVGQSFPVQ